MNINKYFLTGIVCCFYILYGCTASTNKQTPSVSESVVNVAVEHEEHDLTLPLPKRLAFMSGHVQAGLALYRAGELKMAAPHLLHPVSETHASERVGLDALGFNGSLFEYVSFALEQNRPASEIEIQLKAAEENLIQVTEKAGGDDKEIINFLLDTVLKEYAIGVPSNKVTDIGEYQDAYGFTVVAIQHAEKLNNQKLQANLEKLLQTWPVAPVPPENPSKLEEIKLLVGVIKKSL